MDIKVFVTTYSSNSYLVIKDKEAVIIDAGGSAKDILTFADANNIDVKAVLLTHTHYDHIAGLNDYFARGIPVCVHRDEAKWLQQGSKNLAPAFGQEFVPAKEADIMLGDNEVIRCSGIDIEVIHTPGHSPGGVCLRIGDSLFTGDTLFLGSIGRYDLPGSDGVLLRKSIREKLLTLDDGLTIYPGHGDKSSIGHEKQHNPYLS